MSQAANCPGSTALRLIAVIGAAPCLLVMVASCGGNGDNGASIDTNPTPIGSVRVTDSRFVPTDIGQVDEKIDSLFEVYPSLETEEIAGEMTLREVVQVFKPDCENTSLPAENRAESCATLILTLWYSTFMFGSAESIDAAIIVKNYAITEMPEQEKRILDLVREAEEELINLGDAEDARETPIRRTPTPSGPRLTGAEAAGKTEAYLRNSLREQNEQSGVDVSNIFIYCDPEDFNDGTDTWIVLCTYEFPARSLTVRYQVDDRTGFVTPVE